MTDDAEIPRVEPRRAFPKSLHSDVQHVAAVLPASMHASHYSFSVASGGEELVIPERVYSLEVPGAVMQQLSPTQRLIVHCIYTRHHDGFIRERHLLPVVEAGPEWAAPYVLRLLGEYVIEIHDVIHANLEKATGASYREFAAENPAFVARTKAQIVSYWTCYYRWPDSRERRVYWNLFEYPAYLVADALGWWRRSEFSRLRAR